MIKTINNIIVKVIYSIGNNIKKEYKILLFFLFIFFLMIILHLPQGNFMDEIDNLMGARSVSKGGVVYKDFYSQHMPIKYYILSIFVKLGADTVPLFRISYYFIFTVFFIFIYFRYKKYFGYKTFLLLPVFFILDIARHTLMYTVLSDGFQAMALLLLFMEFYIFCINKPDKIKISSLLCICFSIFIAIGVAFLSIYSITVICFGVLLLEIEKFYLNKTMSIKDRFKDISTRYLSLFILLGLILIIYFSYFIINNSLKNMIYQSYTFNIEVYSKYTNNFNSKINTLINTIINYGEHIKNIFNNLNEFNTKNILSILLVISNIGISFMFFQKNKILGFITLFYTIYTGIRGYTEFHSTAYILFSWFCLSYLIEKLIISKNSEKLLFIVIFVSIISFLPIYSQGGHLERIPNIKKIITENKNKNKNLNNYYIDKYVSPGGYIFNNSLYDLTFDFYNNYKVASRVYTIVPWFAETFINDIVDDLEKNKPNVIFYDPNEDIWGYKIGDYCQPLEDFLYKEYIKYVDTDPEYNDNDSHRVWLYKSISSANMKSDEQYYSSGKHVGEITNELIIRQIFKSNHNNLKQISIYFATFIRENNSDIIMQLLDDKNNLLRESILNTSTFKDNSYDKFKFESIIDSKDKYFTLVISSNDATYGNAVTICRTDSEKFNGELYLNDVLQDDNLCIVPGYLID